MGFDMYFHNIARMNRMRLKSRTGEMDNLLIMVFEVVERPSKTAGRHTALVWARDATGVCLVVFQEDVMENYGEEITHVGSVILLRNFTFTDNFYAHANKDFGNFTPNRVIVAGLSNIQLFQ